MEGGHAFKSVASEVCVTRRPHIQQRLNIGLLVFTDLELSKHGNFPSLNHNNGSPTAA